MQIKDRVFAITGGVSGLGAATAQYLVDRGARVLLMDVNEDKGEAIAGELGDSARFAKVDVTNEDQTKQALDQTVEEHGALHGLVNCAGIGTAAKVLGRDGVHDLGMFTKVIQINLIGTFNVSRLAAEHMTRNEVDAEGERGTIINTASVAAFEGQIGQAAYSASKGGVSSMTLPMARELGKHGIRVVCIAPGVFETPMVGGMKSEVQESLISQVPFPPRLGKPKDYALMVGNILDNVMLNGCTIRLDGAIRMGPR